jgi:FtsZ-interacting cell division protein ZipA
MSTLTWVLLILAAIVIGGVLVYNFAQNRGREKAPRGQREEQREGQRGSQLDAQLSKSLASSGGKFPASNIEATSSFSAQKNNASLEPSIGVLTPYHADEPSLAKSEPSVPSADKRTESVTEPEVFPTLQEQAELLSPPMQFEKTADAVVVESTVSTDSLSNTSPPASVLSEEFDYLVEFVLPSPQSGERLLSLTAAHRRAGGKPVAFDGLLPTGQWLTLQAGQLYVALRAGLLMANRHGPLNAMEFSDFGNLMTTLSQQLDCDASVADMPTILNRAREVDRRCAELDAQLGINIRTSSPTSPAMLGAVAAEHSLVERGGSRFARLDETGATLFTLSFGEQTDRLSMLLDVPRAPANSRPWQLMLSCAMSLAQRLEGELVDDSGKPLPDQVWPQIEEQLRQRYWALEGAGIVPGSSRALRLFN